MQKILLFIIPILLAVGIFSGFLYLQSKQGGKGALQVTSVPESAVYLDGKQIGKTPLCKCEPDTMLPTGQYTIKLVPTNPDLESFEQKITLTQRVLTVVDRTFGVGATSQGSIISLTPLKDKKARELLVLSFPDKATILLDNTPSGDSPLRLKQVTESDHEIKVSKDGYKDKILRIRTVTGYQLEAVVFLGVNPNLATPSATPTPTSSTPLTPTVTPSAKVTILETPTGFLRVRDSASVSGLEVARVNPGEIYDLLTEQTGWFEIRLTDGKTGWISSQYASKQ